MTWSLKFVERGSLKTIHALQKNGRCKSIDFLDDRDIAVRRIFKSYFQKLSETGVIRNASQCKYLRDDIWELKSGKFRIYYFEHESDLIILTNAGEHKEPKRQKRDIEKAVDLKNEYLKQLGE